jgi:hypothetical protein
MSLSPGRRPRSRRYDALTRIESLEHRALLAAPVIINGDLNPPNNDDAFVLRLNPADSSQIEVLINNDAPINIPFLDATNIVVNGLAGNDQLYVDFTYGSPIPAGGLFFDGGAGENLLQVNGNGNFGASYFFGASGAPDVVSVGDTQTTFQNAQIVKYFGFSNIGVTPNGGVNTLSLSGDGQGGTLVAASDDGAPLQSLSFQSNGIVTYDLAANDTGTAQDDSVTVDVNAPFAPSSQGFAFYTGNGSDTVILESMLGNHFVDAGAGDDFVTGGEGNDSLFGGLGIDAIAGSGGDDLISGGEGDDLLFGDEGDDVIFGGDGNDEIAGGIGADLLVGGAGNDSIAGNEGDDVIFGGLDNDLILGGLGNDTIFGNLGDDTLLGGDFFTASNPPRQDLLDGDDEIYGGDGFDLVDGGGGNNRLDAGDDVFNETVYAAFGNDIGFNHRGFLVSPQDTLLLDGGDNAYREVGGLVEVEEPFEPLPEPFATITPPNLVTWIPNEPSDQSAHGPSVVPVNSPYRGAPGLPAYLRSFNQKSRGKTPPARFNPLYATEGPPIVHRGFRRFRRV